MTRAGSSRERALGQTFVQLASSLANGFDVVELFAPLVAGCTDLLGTAACGLMLADARGQLQVMASSSEDTRTLELFELHNDEGPCLDCYHTREIVAVVDPAEQAARWPVLAQEIRSQGFGPTYALPMRLAELTIGALSLYCTPDSPLSDDDLHIGQALADVATLTLVQYRNTRAAELLAHQLQTALTSRIAIEQAKGVISAHAKIDMESAFELLRGHARRTQSRLSELAADIASGRMSPDELRPSTRRETAG